MKFLVLFAVLAAASAQIQRVNPFAVNPFARNQYRPYSTPAPFAYSTPSPFNPYVPVSTIAPPVAPVYPSPTPLPSLVAKVANYDGRYANTLRYENEINPDGSYSYAFETDNGISAQAQGVPRNFGGNPPVVPDVAQGSFSWVSPEGQQIVISYIADENGYQPSGDAIPTPPPIPPQIARALEYIARSAPRK